MKWVEWLQGKKTYIIVVLASIFNIGVVFGWWTVESTVWGFINSILGFLGIGTLRAGTANEVKKLAK